MIFLIIFFSCFSITFGFFLYPVICEEDYPDKNTYIALILLFFFFIIALISILLYETNPKKTVEINGEKYEVVNKEVYYKRVKINTQDTVLYNRFSDDLIKIFPNSQDSLELQK